MALNLWGDREVTWVDGRRMSEKELGRMLKVQFTPTVLMFEEQANVVARLNGYYPAPRMEAALDHVAARMEARVSLAEYPQGATKEPASATLNPQPFFARPPHDRPELLPPRDELHRDGLRRPDVNALLGRFNVVRLDTADTSALTSALDYVASGAYREQPSFQRFVQTRADRLRARGEAVDLWR